MRSLFPDLIVALSLSEPAIADDLMTIDVTIKDHRFSPSEIHVPAGKPTVLWAPNLLRATSNNTTF
jgi:hypothetical protein